jgi:hypothetical protein
MRIVVLDESKSGEPRVAVTPETIRKLAGLGASVTVQSGAGAGSSIPDAEFTAAGATVVAGKDLKSTLAEADILLGVSRPDAASLKGIRKGALALATMDPYGNAEAIQPLADALASPLRHGTDAAHHPRAGDGRAVLAGQPCRLSRRARRRRPNMAAPFPMMMTAAGTVPAAKRLHHGRRRCRAAGDRHRAAPGRHRHRDRRAAGDQGAGRIARRQVPRGRGRGVQAGPDGRRLRQGNVEGISGQAGRTDRQPHRQAGHRHHHGADPRPAGAAS